MRVLGLDASTSTIGYALISDDLKLLKLDYYKPKKTGTIWSRLLETKKFIAKLINDLKPDVIVIEDILLFMAGASTAKTITSLAIFNRTVGLTALEVTGKEVTLLPVTTIRAQLKQGFGGASESQKLSKEDIPERVAQILGISFPYQINKKGNLLKENGDMADAAAVALAYLRKTNGLSNSLPSTGSKPRRNRTTNQKKAQKASCPISP